MNQLRDIQFDEFDWATDPTGDLALVETLESFRGLVNRWLLTSPAEDPDGLTDEETEIRRAYADETARGIEYDEPDGDRLAGCIPWDPTWGLGVKRYCGRPITPALVAEVTTAVRNGLARLQGVRRVVNAAVSGTIDTLQIGWAVESDWGIVGDSVAVD